MTRLYHVPGSRSTRVQWMLEEIGAPYELTVMTREDRKTAVAGHGDDDSAITLFVELHGLGHMFVHQHHHGDRPRFGLYHQMRNSMAAKLTAGGIADDTGAGV